MSDSQTLHGFQGRALTLHLHCMAFTDVLSRALTCFHDFHGRALTLHLHCVLIGSVVSFCCDWIKDSLWLYCNEAGTSELLSTSTAENPNLSVTDHVKLI